MSSIIIKTDLRQSEKRPYWLKCECYIDLNNALIKIKSAVRKGNCILSRLNRKQLNELEGLVTKFYEERLA